MTTTSLTLADPCLTAPTTRRRGAQAKEWLLYLVVGLVAFLPLLLLRRGVATPDTKTYLYLDPAKFLAQVASMWDPTVAAGTVTHEYVGYLLPMGPFFLLTHWLGIHLWIAQRLWLGSIVFAAGAGVLYLCRVLKLRGLAPLAAALFYMLSPYVLQYAGRISVILLPWSGLPWMLAFTVLALRRPGWRFPALFALSVALTSSINASSIIFVGFAPVLWILYVWIIEREVPWKRVLIVTLQLGVLTIGVCLWWIAGLALEAGYGVDVLKYTETVVATSGSSSSAEVMRGLGYWYFYGTDRLGPWTNVAVLLTQNIPVLVISYAVPFAALLAGLFARWRYRSYFILLVVVGAIWSVGAHPFTSPTPVGGLLKTFMTTTTAGLALRSTDRATPLIILGLAMLLGSGLGALHERFARSAIPVTLLAIVLIFANTTPVLRGDFIANDFTQPAKLPKSEMAAISYLNSVNPGTRVLALPGNDFASFRWGNTVDSPQPAYLTRPFLIHEQQVMGSTATADMLYALDEPVQDNIANPRAIAPIARLLSVGNLLIEYDTQYEHFGQPHPQSVAAILAPTPPGLTGPKNFGSTKPNVPVYPTLDEQDLALGHAPVALPKVAVYGVTAPRPLVRAESDHGALIVSGDGTGLENLASTGLLNTTSAVFFSGTLVKDQGRISSLLKNGAAIAITDTNRKQGFRWDTISSTAGATETAQEDPQRSDPTDAPIELFPAAPLTAKTLATYLGASSVTASSYGSPFDFAAEDRPFSALDGNLDTAWRTGIFGDPQGQWWQVSLTTPAVTDHITLVQPQTGDLSRHITKVTLLFDGEHAFTARLGPASLMAGGQVITFPTRTFRTLRVLIDQTTHQDAVGSAASSVGFAEVQIPGHSVSEAISMPTDLTSRLGTRSIANRLSYVMTRWRTSPYPPRSDPETSIDRVFHVPTPRTFTLSGNATLSPLIPDDEIDRLLGRPPAIGDQVTAFSSGRLPGSLRNTASTTLDGDPTTYWQPGFDSATRHKSWLQYDLSHPLTLSSLPMTIVDDGRHSVPTSVTISSGTEKRTVAIPPLARGNTPGSVDSTTLAFAPITGSEFRLTFDTFVKRTTTNYNTTIPLVEPIGIAEVGLPGIRVPALPPTIPAVCHSNLITIDGHPQSVMIQGKTAAALDLRPVSLVPCGTTINGVSLQSGTHLLVTAVGHSITTGWNVDQVLLDSSPGGVAGPTPVVGSVPATQPGAVPVVHSHLATTTAAAKITEVHGPFTLVLGESINRGWHATISATGTDGIRRSLDLGPPLLIDGLANSWHVSNHVLAELHLSQLHQSGASLTIHLQWRPQSLMNMALGASAVVLLIVLVLIFYTRRRRQRTREAVPARLTIELPEGAAMTRAEIQALRRRAQSTRTIADDLPAVTTGSIVLPQDSWQQATPVLITPFTPGRVRARWWVALLAAVVVGAIGYAIEGWSAGFIAAAVVLAGLLVTRLRGLAGIGSLGFFVASVASVVSIQLSELYGVGNWPEHFSEAGTLMWIAIALYGSDAVINVIERRQQLRTAIGQDPPAQQEQPEQSHPS